VSDPLGPRWTEGPLLGREGEERALSLLRQAPAPLPWSDVAAQRVLRRLRTAPQPGPRWRWALRPALVVAVALVLGGAAAAARALLLRRPAPLVAGQSAAQAPAPPPPAALPSPDRPPSAGRAPSAAVAVPPSAPARRSRRGAHAASAPRSHARSAAPAAARTKAIPPARAAEDGSLAEETRLFRAALARLRVARDPHGALALLDGYAATFPHGSYLDEAAVARIDALLAAGRRAAALAALRSMSLATLPRRVELTVMRAELAAAAGDCRGARHDFDAALAERLPPALEERSLYGRALCRNRAGDRPGARADLDGLLSRYPTGLYAPAARAALRDL
jgi:hypothetical protein